MSFIPAMLMTATATCLIGNGNVQSTNQNIAKQDCNNKKVIMQQQNIGSQEELKEFLNKNGISLNKWNNSDCKPEINQPGNNNPGGNKPGAGNGNTQKPETGKPENGETTNSSYAAQVVDLVNKERA